MEFPHIKDTAFPHLNNVDVYAYKNDFDYTRWGINTEIKLVNVLWHSSYDDVVKFDSDKARDDWFDSIDDYYAITLRTPVQMPPDGIIKLPIPYDVMARYNYMYIDIPVMPGTTPPIEYENDNIGVRRWYFFIEQIGYRAPNATACSLSLDVWTQYVNDVSIKYMYLERGHAPVAATSVREYLSNPISNNKYLLTPDVTPTNAEITRTSKYISFGNGKKYLCFASSVAPAQISRLGVAKHNIADYTHGKISYSNTSDRYGYQLVVKGYGSGNGDDYSNLTAPAGIPTSNDGRIMNNSYVYAIDAHEGIYGGFINDVIANCPTFLSTLFGCFVVDESMITLGREYTIASHKVRICTGNDETLDTIELNEDMFGFPERYQRFAKLYTFPYSSMELIDNEGKKVTVRIENTGNIQAHKLTSIAFPYLNARMMFTGINGVGAENYEWKQLDNSSVNKLMPNSDWFDYCFDHEIPCYALYMDGGTAWYLDNFNKMVRGSRRSALADYHNSVRNANTERANAVDMNNTIQTNANANASTLVSNTANSCSAATSNTALAVAASSAITANNNYTSSLVTDRSNTVAESNTGSINGGITLTTAAENETTAANANVTAAGSVIGGGMSGAAAGAVAGPMGAAIGFLGGVAGGVVSACVGTASANNVMQCNSETASVTIAKNSAQSANTRGGNTANTAAMNNAKTYETNEHNAVLTGQTANNNAAQTANTANNAATIRNNASRTASTGNANAGYTREVGVLNAKETLESTMDVRYYDYLDARNGKPRAYGIEGGNYAPDYYQTRGVQMKIKTMSDAEVIQVGDWFARFGYALNQNWDVEESGLCPMKHFCYWKAVDVWIDNRQGSNNSVETLLIQMFTRGVTVWNNPDEIGRIDIYAN